MNRRWVRMRKEKDWIKQVGKNIERKRVDTAGG